MKLADMLSRAYLKDDGGDRDDDEILTFDDDGNVSQALGGSLAVSEERLKQIKDATVRDQAMTELKNVILEGWPETKRQVSPLVKPFYGLRDELVIQDGLVFRGQRVIIPDGLRSLMLERIHSSHMGVNSSIRRAKENLYWPGMNSQVKDMVERCDICQQREVAQQKETLRPHHIPERPWVKLGADLCTFQEKEYLITVDYYSSFVEVDPLQKTTASAVIRE